MLKAREFPGGKQTKKNFDLTALLGKCPKGKDHALIQKTSKSEKRDSEYRDTNREGKCFNSEGQDYLGG
jgi:hypothetical protein